MECSFCRREIEPGTETIFVTRKGKASYFCSSKCEKNLLKLGRKPRRVKWTEDYRSEKAIRLKSITSKKEEEKVEKKAVEKEKEVEEEKKLVKKEEKTPAKKEKKAVKKEKKGKTPAKKKEKKAKKK